MCPSLFTLSARYCLAFPSRAVIVILTIALAFASYVLLAAFGSPFSTDVTPRGSQTGSIFVAPLYGSMPLYYAQLIANMRGVRSVSYNNFMPVMCQPGVSATLNGVGAINQSTLVSIPASAEQKSIWEGQRDAMLVGSDLAQRCHWQTGQLLSLKGMMGAKPNIEVQIAGIYHAGTNDPALNQVAFVHFQYLNGLYPASLQGVINILIAQASDIRDAASLAVRIDARFANGSPPTQSSTDVESESALGQFGNVMKIMEFVMAAVFACVLLVTVNGSAHAAAERRNDFALLLALGFRRGWISVVILMELVYMTVFGCGFGLALGLAAQYSMLAPALVDTLPTVASPPWFALMLAPALVAGIVAVSASIPIWEVSRLRAMQLRAV